LRVEQEITINVASQYCPYQPFGYISLKSENQTFLFNVYRDSDINLDVDHLLPDEFPP